MSEMPRRPRPDDFAHFYRNDYSPGKDRSREMYDGPNDFAFSGMFSGSLMKDVDVAGITIRFPDTADLKKQYTRLRERPLNEGDAHYGSDSDQSFDNLCHWLREGERLLQEVKGYEGRSGGEWSPEPLLQAAANAFKNAQQIEATMTSRYFPHLSK